MATHDQAVAVKGEVRRQLRRLGAVVVSVGVEDTPHGALVSVGVASDPARLPARHITIDDVPVRIFRQAFGSI